MNHGFAEAWRHLLDAPPERTGHEFAELLNTFEIAAAIHQEGSVRGVAKELLEDYLCRALTVVNRNDDAKRLAGALRESPTTFKYVIRFVAEMTRRGRTEGIETLVNMEPRW